MGAPNANFTGNWLCTAVEGEPDEFLSEIGIGYVQRTMASTMGYGKGRAQLAIVHDGDNFECKSTGGPKDHTEKVVLGGGVQRVQTPHGEVSVEPTWEAETIVVKNLDKGTTARRFIESGKFVVEVTSPKGKTMRRVHERQ